jgi:hypothetical protein
MSLSFIWVWGCQGRQPDIGVRLHQPIEEVGGLVIPSLGGAFQGRWTCNPISCRCLPAPSPSPGLAMKSFIKNSTTLPAYIIIRRVYVCMHQDRGKASGNKDDYLLTGVLTLKTEYLLKFLYIPRYRKRWIYFQLTNIVLIYSSVNRWTYMLIYLMNILG